MNREDIIRMAQECHLVGMRPHLDGIYQESLERFAALVAAAERKALRREMEDQNTWDLYDPAATAIAIIRARGQ